jgi:hypothetical protein
MVEIEFGDMLILKSKGEISKTWSMVDARVKDFAFKVKFIQFSNFKICSTSSRLSLIHRFGGAY